MLRISKRHLLVLAGLLWAFAGFQIIKIGIASLTLQHLPMICIVGSASIIFVIFLRFIFLKLVKKHTIRIHAFKEKKKPFYCFFDKPSYLIMICMMCGGILIRKFKLLPFEFIAFFYIGLGSALLLSGLLYLYQWVIFESKEELMQS